MYPSIMIGHNICYTTRVDPAHPEQPSDEDEVHTAPTGVRFWSDDHRTGLVPFLPRDLMARVTGTSRACAMRPTSRSEPSMTPCSTR